MNHNLRTFRAVFKDLSSRLSVLVLYCPVSTRVLHQMCWTYLITYKSLALKCQRSYFPVAAINMSVFANRFIKVRY